jgi:hypothetical protein
LDISPRFGILCQEKSGNPAHKEPFFKATKERISSYVTARPHLDDKNCDGSLPLSTHFVFFT